MRYGGQWQRKYSKTYVSTWYTFNPRHRRRISEFKASLPYTALGQQETLHRSMEMQILLPVLKLSSGPQANPILDNPWKRRTSAWRNRKDEIMVRSKNRGNREQYRGKLSKGKAGSLKTSTGLGLERWLWVGSACCSCRTPGPVLSIYKLAHRCLFLQLHRDPNSSWPPQATA